MSTSFPHLPNALNWQHSFNQHAPIVVQQPSPLSLLHRLLLCWLLLLPWLHLV
jgi:hypothetical protein